MSLNGLLNQTIVVYGKTSYNAYGREVVSGSATSVKARFQPQTKTRLLPNGAVLTIDAVAYVPANTTINVDDRVDVGTTRYKVLAKYPTPDGQGNTNHIKIELIKWQET